MSEPIFAQPGAAAPAVADPEPAPSGGNRKALLAVAMAWKGSRKLYLEGAVAMGLKPNTAGAWWQVARKGGK